MSGHPQGDEFGLAGQTFDVPVEAGDGTAADVDLAPDRIIDGGIIGEQLRDLIAGAGGDEVQITVHH